MVAWELVGMGLAFGALADVSRLRRDR